MATTEDSVISVTKVCYDSIDIYLVVGPTILICMHTIPRACRPEPGQVIIQPWGA